MTYRFKMHAELMGAAGSGPQQQQGIRTPGSNYGILGHRVFSRIRNGKAFTVPCVTANMGFDDALFYGGCTTDYCRIDFFNRTLLELIGKKGKRLFIPGGDDNPARILVKPVYNPRPDISVCIIKPRFTFTAA
jgi:hypothetical protein